MMQEKVTTIYCIERRCAHRSSNPFCSNGVNRLRKNRVYSSEPEACAGQASAGAVPATAHRTVLAQPFGCVSVAEPRPLGQQRHETSRPQEELVGRWPIGNAKDCPRAFLPCSPPYLQSRPDHVTRRMRPASSRKMACAIIPRCRGDGAPYEQTVILPRHAAIEKPPSRLNRALMNCSILAAAVLRRDRMPDIEALDLTEDVRTRTPAGADLCPRAGRKSRRGEPISLCPQTAAVLRRSIRANLWHPIDCPIAPHGWSSTGDPPACCHHCGQSMPIPEKAPKLETKPVSSLRTGVERICDRQNAVPHQRHCHVRHDLVAPKRAADFVEPDGSRRRLISLSARQAGEPRAIIFQF